MPSDSDPIIVTTRCPDNFAGMTVDILSHIQYKFLSLMLIMFLMLNSDVFINRVLGQFSGTLDHKYPTNWGIFLQGMFLVICMLIIDIFIRQKVI